jgi:hypothetical protein
MTSQAGSNNKPTAKLKLDKLSRETAEKLSPKNTQRKVKKIWKCSDELLYYLVKVNNDQSLFALFEKNTDGEYADESALS